MLRASVRGARRAFARSPAVAPFFLHRLRARPVYHQHKVFYRQFLNLGDLCFDVGANAGERTVAFVGLNARVVAVEPQRMCAQWLRALFARTPTVTVIGAALGDHEGYAEISICEDTSELSTMSDRWRTSGRFASSYKWTRSESVPMTTLDQLIAIYGRPAFCKIDVEGSEPAVLRGLSQPLPCISFEFTREFLDDAQSCLAHLRSLGAVMVNYALGDTLALCSPEWLGVDSLVERLAAYPDHKLWGDIYVRST